MVDHEHGYEDELDEKIVRILKTDLSRGTEIFRDDLLRRCLVVLGEGEECREIDDGDLDLIAAAGENSYHVSKTFPI